VVEALTLTGVLAAIVGLSAPYMIRFKSTLDVQSASAQVSGVLRVARARAIADAVPRLVLFEDEEVVDGTRSAFARVVKDVDRSYSVTPPDEVETFALDASVPAHVGQYDPGSSALPGLEGGSGSALDGDYTSLIGDYSAKMAAGDATGNYSDVLAMYADKAEDWAGAGSPGCSGPGPCLDPSHADYEAALDPNNPAYDPAAVLALLKGTYDPTSLTHGTTFPISQTEGVPAMAFNERGIPVALDSAKALGTGAGAVYVSDGAYAVYASIISPMGEVSARRYDVASGTWK
jgi:hypothetical protein